MSETTGIEVQEYHLVDVENGEQPSPSRELGSPKKSTKLSAPTVQWSGLNFSAGKASILSNVWGRVEASRVCAIMGPSGAGKSSLLNVLAGRSAPAPGIVIEGKVEVAGKVINPVAFRKNIAYVMQDDAMLATATPREALAFSANMRLPSSFTAQQIHELVDHLLEELGLTVCADVMIGGALIKGISGGQRKRTSVGVELITNPALLFLDEPTSGLDSYSAFALITLLKKVAVQDGCTILCTIHQPSSEVFFLFDTVIFMKAGRIFYQGPVSDAVSHFHKLGYECPSNYNPSDFIMSLTQTVSHEEAESKGVYMTVPASLDDQNQSIRFDETEVEFKTESSFIKQLGALTYRELVNTKRDIGALIGRFGVTIILNLLYGLIFFNAGGKNDGDNTNFQSHFGAMTMVLISSMFGAAQPVMLNFPFERPMFMREYSTGTYGAMAYFISKVLVELPLTFLQTIVQFILVYFLVDMQGNYILLVLAAWGLGVASCSVAVAIGCSVPDVKQVTELAPLLFVPQMLFVGFFIRTSQIPVYLRWAQYLCSLKYAMNLVLMNEFHAGNDSCQSSPEAQANCKNVLSNNDVDTDNFYIYIIILFALFVAFRTLGGMILVQKAKRFY